MRPGPATSRTALPIRTRVHRRPSRLKASISSGSKTWGPRLSRHVRIAASCSSIERLAAADGAGCAGAPDTFILRKLLLQPVSLFALTLILPVVKLAGKVAVYTIAKNEAKHVKRWFDSAKGADYFLICDMGRSRSARRYFWKR